MKAKYLFIFVIFLIITGCQNSSFNKDLDEEQKIYIHETTKNYGGLIELYKNRLKHSDTADTRYKLARAYYLSEDFNSAERALSPIITKAQDDNILVLYARVLSKMRHPRYDTAIEYLDKALQVNTKNGEAYNLKGIIQIRIGQYDAARYSFNEARELFYDENKVMNNLAMLAILDKDYMTAYGYLNTLYNKGYRNKAVLHNIVFTLVKLDKTSVAKQFCIEHKLSDQPTILIEELKRVEPNKTVHFNELVPTPNQMKKAYEVEEKATISNDLKPIIMAKPKNITIAAKDITEKASLNLLNPSLVAVRSGEHKSFSRITLETNNKLNDTQYTVKKENDNSYQIQLLNVDLSSITTEQIIKRIASSNRNFTHVTAQYNADKTLTLTIQVKNVSNHKVFYAGKGNKGHCIAIDFYLTQ